MSLFMLILVATDSSSLVCYITRFTEENFALLIAIIFILGAFQKIYQLFMDYPLVPISEPMDLYNGSPFTSPLANATHIHENTKQFTDIISNNTSIETLEVEQNVENVFLMSVLLFAGTYFIATKLKSFNSYRFFPTWMKSQIANFAVVIAIVTMTLVDFFTGVNTPKLLVPSTVVPSIADRSWLVDPFGGNPWWTALVAIIPALLGTILVFMDQQITVVIVNRKVS